MKKLLHHSMRMTIGLIGIAFLCTVSVSIARDRAHGTFHRSSASACASAASYVKHTPLEIEACITDATRIQMQAKGVMPVLFAIQRSANHAPLLKTFCHLSMHQLGREQQQAGLTTQSMNGSLPSDANWNSSCVGGFLHGYMQNLAGASGASDLVAIARSWCAPMNSQDSMGCAHAIGHGLSRSRHDNLRSVAADCLAVQPRLQRDCLSGAVMEINFADARLADRMKTDAHLGPPARIRCSVVAASQRSWCRALFVKGEGLTAALRTVA